MTRKTLILLATLGSAALLLGAFGFQHLGGLAPCKLCLWQRWPHAAAILIGVALLAGGHRLLAWLGALAAATTAGIGAYHAGVEWGWWPGPQSCTGVGDDAISLDMLSDMSDVRIVPCDAIQWELLGISLAGFNALISAAIVVLLVLAIIGQLRRKA